ncbi:UPF0481 protein At3g47200-like [Triticum aestivum]|uniref:UPF0481 protein At3g47200-like n=1 Tax=Triticum aestivum TaxID=4565 RepID=UPI001D0053D2|nr:UPF0481 protein At3g47200-like [Triticum aestivum]
MDMSELVRSMTQELDYYWSLDAERDCGKELCLIYKVQQHIRDYDRFAYEPCIVSVGPYHHGSASLLRMENVKWGYLDVIMRLSCQKNLLDYLTTLGALAKQARSCYSEDINMESESFLKMLLLDGCYILCSLGVVTGLVQNRLEQYQCANAQETKTASGGDPEHVRNDNVVTEDTEASHENIQVDREENIGEQYCEQTGYWFIRFINHDLLLLENQIPFFILETIFELVTVGCASPPCLTDELAKYVESALRWYPKAIVGPDRPKHFQHLLHLCHIYFLPSQRPEEDHNYNFKPWYFHSYLSFGRKYFKLSYYLDNNDHDNSSHHKVGRPQGGDQLTRWRRAAQYLEAGIKIKRREYDILDPHSLLDIRFRNGVMEIPCIVMDEYTGGLFRNLIAFEQTCPQFGDDFTAYIVFLSQLISMPEDVTLLAKREIILHQLDSDDNVSDLFTTLHKEVVFDFNGNHYLKSLCQTMEAHYQNRINRWMAWLWLNHFRNPWLALGACVAVIVLVCTIVQTVYGILAYVNPPE